MVVTKREFIFATVVLSGLSTAMLITSFATTSWVTGSLVNNLSDGLNSVGLLSTISYGLFEGTFTRVIVTGTQLVLNIHIACLMEHNACVWSCQLTSADRHAEAIVLWKTGCVDEEEMVQACAPQFQGQGDQNGNVANTSCAGKDMKFTNAGLWVSTIFFLSLSLLMAVVCVCFAVYNAAFNPIQTYFGVLGLYIWNGIAALLDLVTLVLWGSLFGSVLASNVTYTEVITGGFSNSGVSLGYSYWLVMVALFFHCFNLVLLYLRQYLLDHETPPQTPSKLDEYQDGNIYIY